LPSGIDTLGHEDSIRLESMYPSVPRTPKECVTCRGKGSFLWYAGQDWSGDLDEYECSCADQWVMHRAFLWSGIGIAYQRLCWRDVKAEAEAVDKVRAYLDRADDYAANGVGLILHGSIGSGKTLLATLLLRALLAMGFSGHFSTFTGLIDTFASGWHDEDQRVWFHRQISNTDVLVIDDIGREFKQRHMVKGEGTVERSRPLVVSTLDEVIRFRVANAKPTIITTNLTMDDLVESYGGNVMSLLRERSVAKVFRGADFRDRARQRISDEIEEGVQRPVMVG
jgi:DNA replication protein DnaC